jgi:arsenite methyltransferase
LFLFDTLNSFGSKHLANERKHDKGDIKKQYAKIALGGNSESCCMPGECGCGSTSPGSLTASRAQVAERIGYNEKDLESILKESIVGVSCGAPLNFADIKEGATVVD